MNNQQPIQVYSEALAEIERRVSDLDNGVFTPNHHISGPPFMAFQERIDNVHQRILKLVTDQVITMPDPVHSLHVQRPIQLLNARFELLTHGIDVAEEAHATTEEESLTVIHGYNPDKEHEYISVKYNGGIIPPEYADSVSFIVEAKSNDGKYDATGKEIPLSTAETFGLDIDSSLAPAGTEGQMRVLVHNGSGIVRTEWLSFTFGRTTQRYTVTKMIPVILDPTPADPATEDVTASFTLVYTAADPPALPANIMAHGVAPPMHYYKLKLDYTLDGKDITESTEWAECPTELIIVKEFEGDLSGDITATIYMNDKPDGSGKTSASSTRTFSSATTATIDVYSNGWTEYDTTEK